MTDIKNIFEDAIRCETLVASGKVIVGYLPMRGKCLNTKLFQETQQTENLKEMLGLNHPTKIKQPRTIEKFDRVKYGIPIR